MRAVVIHTYGDEDVLRVEEIPTPEPGEHQVRITVAGAAVNRTDLSRRQGLYPVPGPGPHAPFTFGMDVAGTVDAVGAGVTDFRVGQAVVAFAGPPTTPAAQAEHVVLPVTAVTPAPRGVPLTQAATLPLNGLTAAQALDRAGLPEGATVVVTGAAGGLGVFLVQLAHMAGHRVIAWVKPGTDIEELTALGADEVITAAEQVTAASADAVLDAATLGQDTIDVIKDGGAYVTFRGTNPALSRGVRQVAVWVHADAEALRELVEAIEKGDLRLSGVTEMPLEQVADAQARFAAGGIRDRLVLVP